ncbi:MAG: hypothetical protein JWQ25_2400 [Daejeonella sp.]|nr:hypothetical protein [Daejeonella sp.]
MANLIDITNWEEKPWYSTGGTRDKCLVESQEGDLYYFKTSLRKERIDYKYEFWSEIIASELGKILGINVLQYDIAIKDEKIGCLCKSMVKGQERLTQGMNYLVGYDNNYDGNPKDKNQKSLYSYQLIVEALHAFQLDKFIPNIDEIIVFDALIGNGDRHQENWAIIYGYIDASKRIQEVFGYSPSLFNRKVFGNSPSLFNRSKNRFLKYLTSSKIDQVESIGLFTQTMWDKDVRFSPIYDSGSSLAREHNDEKLEQMLRDKMQFEAYLDRGRAEIHWEGNKMNHFQLVNKILEKSERARSTINLFEKNYNQEAINEFINSIDNQLPADFDQYKLTNCRKEFLIKLITSRYQRIINL